MQKAFPMLLYMDIDLHKAFKIHREKVGLLTLLYTEVDGDKGFKAYL